MNQPELARQLNRRQPWLSKLIDGQGNATIDDWIGIARYFNQTLDQFVQVDGPALDVQTGVLVRDEDEKRLLRLWRRVPIDPPGHHQILFDLIAIYIKRVRQLPPRELPAQTRRKRPARVSKVRGKREPLR